jgi:hypothetical protein
VSEARLVYSDSPESILLGQQGGNGERNQGGIVDLATILRVTLLPQKQACSAIFMAGVLRRACASISSIKRVIGLPRSAQIFLG